MVRIALVGDAGSGGSTVLGLLYAAQVRWASNDATAFRFHVAPSAMRSVGDTFEQLRAGEFPARKSPPGSETIEFLLERPASGVSSLRERWRSIGHAGDGARRIEWTRVAWADLRAHLRTGGFSLEGERQLEGSDVLAVLVPAGAVGGSDAAEASDCDGTLAESLTRVDQENRSGARSPTSVAFIFTMLDRLPAARRRELGLPVSFEDPIPPDRRESIGRGLLQGSMPKTRALIGPERTGDRSVGISPQYFFSWVETDPADPARPRLRPSPVGGWEPTYPFAEYVALIEACNRWAGDRR
jgi:hypothetical protein